MSKSLGNVISPADLVAKYGTEATRYLLLRHVHPFDDTDITWERLDEWYTANLVNGLGNLTARIMKMAETHLQEGTLTGLSFPEIVKYADDALISITDGLLVVRYGEAIENYDLQSVLNSVWFKIQLLDLKITETEPFKLIKQDFEAGKLVIKELVKSLCEIGALLEPFMPETSKIILQAIKENKKPENLFVRLEN